MGDAEEPHDPRRVSCFRLLAHDLNNPLTAIRILAEMLQDEVVDEAQRRDLADVLEAADLAGAQIEGMSSLMRLEGGESDYTWFPVDLAEVLRATVDRPALAAHVELELDLDAHGPGSDRLRISGDRRALQCAFTDVFVNGRRLVENAGPLRVTVRSDEASVAVVVHHPGEGVPADLRAHLSVPYGAVALRRDHRVPVSAVGLGYAAHVVRSHGGTLAFADAEGGMDVVVRLPR